MELINNRNNIIDIFIILLVSIVLVSSVCFSIYEMNKDKKEATKFCESIGLNYSYEDNPRDCYLDNDTIKYTIKIVYDHNKNEYRLLAPGEQQP